MKHSVEMLLYLPMAQQPLWFRVVTGPLSLVNALVTTLRHSLYEHGFIRARTLPGTTISIGNIAVGGTGKTPILISLAKRFCQDRLRVAVLTRGYGVAIPRDGFMVIVDGNLVRHSRCDQLPLPDEALLVSLSLKGVPVIVSPSRHMAASAFLASTPAEVRPNIWLLDDGFQHQQIRRDLNIVLLDAASPLGNRHCLPGGPLRERPRALARADVILFTRSDNIHPTSDDKAAVSQLSRAPQWNVVFSTGAPHQVSGPASSPGTNEWIIAAGIAHPERFAAAMTSQGIEILGSVFRRDHQPFEATDFSNQPQAAAIITTEKDFCRSPQWWSQLGRPIFTCPLDTPIPTDAWEYIRKNRTLTPPQNP